MKVDHLLGYKAPHLKELQSLQVVFSNDAIEKEIHFFKK